MVLGYTMDGHATYTEIVSFLLKKSVVMIAFHIFPNTPYLKLYILLNNSEMIKFRLKY